MLRHILYVYINRFDNPYAGVSTTAINYGAGGGGCFRCNKAVNKNTLHRNIKTPIKTTYGHAAACEIM